MIKPSGQYRVKQRITTLGPEIGALAVKYKTTMLVENFVHIVTCISESATAKEKDLLIRYWDLPDPNNKIFKYHIVELVDFFQFGSSTKLANLVRKKSHTSVVGVPNSCVNCHETFTFSSRKGLVDWLRPPRELNCNSCKNLEVQREADRLLSGLSKSLSGSDEGDTFSFSIDNLTLVDRIACAFYSAHVDPDTLALSSEDLELFEVDDLDKQVFRSVAQKQGVSILQIDDELEKTLAMAEEFFFTYEADVRQHVLVRYRRLRNEAFNIRPKLRIPREFSNLGDYHDALVKSFRDNRISIGEIENLKSLITESLLLDARQLVRNVCQRFKIVQANNIQLDNTLRQMLAKYSLEQLQSILFEQGRYTASEYNSHPQMNDFARSGLFLKHVRNSIEFYEKNDKEPPSRDIPQETFATKIEIFLRDIQVCSERKWQKLSVDEIVRVCLNLT